MRWISDKGELKEYLLLGLICVFGLALRIASRKSSILGDGVILEGYDSYYHMRRIVYTVAHFPDTIWFDSYLDFPNGMQITWPALFDQIAAAFYHILSPLIGHTQGSIELSSSVLAPIIGCVTIIAVYVLAKDIFGAAGGLLAALFMSIAPYSISKTMLGEVDHHGLEALILLVLVIAYVNCCAVGRRCWMHVVLLGMSMAAIAYSWVGAPAYYGIMLALFFVQMTDLLRRNASIKPLASGIMASEVLALLFMAPFMSTTWMRGSFIAMMAILAATVVLYAISEAFRRARVKWYALPISIMIASVIIIALYKAGAHSGLWLLHSVPFIDSINGLLSHGISYLLGGGMTGKIAEAEPLFVGVDFVSWFGLYMLLSIAGLLALLWRLIISASRASVVFPSYLSQDRVPAALIFFVYTLVVLILTIGQKRFLYLYSINAAILYSVLFLEFAGQSIYFARAGSQSSPSAIDDKKTQRYERFLAALLLILLVLPSLMESASICKAAPDAAGAWRESLHWLQSSTPPAGYYDEPGQRPQYGVMSWWDYGNWIVYLGERPAVANNFQTGVIDSATFLLSTTEDQASSIMDERACRYVITDIELIYGKLQAIASWLNADPSRYQMIEQSGDQLMISLTDEGLRTTLSKLHLFDSSGMSRFRLIHESEDVDLIGGVSPQEATSGRIKIFEYVKGAVITGKAPAGRQVAVLLNLTSNTGREFQYLGRSDSVEGRYTVRVPYSTRRDGEVRSTGPYLVALLRDHLSLANESMDQDDLLVERVLEAEVSMEDVMEGRSVTVDFAAQSG
jgi:dolichyl-diphosphooligosaccharide--protein glycosyltransferase